MRWIPDTGGRFPQRLYFDTLRELDAECERLVTYSHFTCFGSELSLPINDDALTTMIERDADIDLYAEIKNGAEAVTEFRPDERPLIRMSAAIAADGERRNRLRTGLAHEWFHAVFHRRVWELLWARDRTNGNVVTAGECGLGDIVGASTSSWIEFQAAFASCAILMPLSVISPLAKVSASNPELVSLVARSFDVSPSAARWRLQHLAMHDRQG